MRQIFGMVVASLFLVTCGSSSQSECQKVGAAICQKACACREGPGCGISDDSGTGTIDFDTEADCNGFFVTLGCMEPDKAYNDAAACLPLVQAATCTGTGTEAAVSFPSAMACGTPP